MGQCEVAIDSELPLLELEGKRYTLLPFKYRFFRAAGGPPSAYKQAGV